MTDKSKEYAEALFLLSEENGESARVAEALDTVSAAFRENPAYMEFLSSPGIPKQERIDALGTAFASLPEIVVSFLQLLCERGRIREFDRCVAEFLALHRAAQSITTATVTSAVPLTDSEKQALNLKLNAMCQKTVAVHWAVDSALLGGVVVDMDGKVLDGSLRHRLQKVKEVMEQ